MLPDSSICLSGRRERGEELGQAAPPAKLAAAPYDLDDPRLLPNARAPRIIVASGIHADETPGMYTRSRLPRARAGQGPGALTARATFRKVCVKLWWEAEPLVRDGSWPGVAAHNSGKRCASASGVRCHEPAWARLGLFDGSSSAEVSIPKGDFPLSARLPGAPAVSGCLGCLQTVFPGRAVHGEYS